MIRPTLKRSLHLESLEQREVPARVGGLDASFGTAGRTTLNFGGVDLANAVAIQPDGKIVAVGTGTAAPEDVTIARFNPDGSPDITFNGTGSQTVPLGNVDVATGVAIQADGKIVVVGFTNASGNNDFAILRLTSTGALDTTFDTDGRLTVAFNLGGGNDDRAAGVAIQGDGKIVVVGSVERVTAGDFDFGIVRINPLDGSLDASFDSDGKRQVFFDIGGAHEDKATSVAIQADGKLVVAGFAETTAGQHDFAVARINPADGSQDNTFDTDGKQTVNFGNDDKANAVAIRTTGQIVLAGSWDGGLADFAVAQMTSTGAPDTSFGGGNQPAASGRFAMTFGAPPFGGAEFATGVAIQKDGKLVVAGRTVTGGSADNFGITRVLANGTGLDPSFNSNGKLTVNFGADDEGNAMVLDNDGRIVVVGSSYADDFALARIIGKVDRATSLIVSGSVDGRGTEFSPNAAGTFGSPFQTPANLFPGFAGNVRSAVADVNGDGFEDAILVTGPGTPIRYAVISGVDDVTPLILPTAPFAGSEDFEGGGFVAAGDLDGDGRAEFIVTPDQGGGPRVTIFSLVGTTPTVRANFFGIDDPAFRGGARAALGDVNADGTPDLAVSAGFLGGPRTALFNGRTLFATPIRLVGDFFAFPGTDAVTLRNGTFVTLGDINGDGWADLIFGGGPGGAPRVFILNGLIVSTGTIDAAYAAPVANFFVAGNSTDRGGVRVAAIDGDSDHRTDLAVGSGEGSVTNVRAYLGKNFTGAGEPAIFQDISVFGGLPLTGGVFVG